MNVQLVVQNGSRGTRVVKLQCEETVIGRRQDCDLRIPSTDVSRRHCLLSTHDGCLNVEDLDSVNGTYVNGRRISGRQIVMPGDRLQIGPVTFLAEYEMDQATLDRVHGEAVEGEVEVVPEANGDTVRGDPTVGDEEGIDVLPLADDEISSEPTKHYPRPKDAAPAEDDAIPLSAEFLDETEWAGPVDGDLRNLLSQMDETRPRGKRKELE
jgi:pSer/pThr/pTyr-binding forkhead associated (FHA) protein